MNRSAIVLKAKQNKRTIAAAFGCGLLLLSSCQIPDLRQAEPVTPVPNTYNRADNSSGPNPAAAGTESSAQIRVEDFFSDPALTQLIQQSLVGNRELKILEEDIQIARSEIIRRRGAYLPFVGLRGGAGLDKTSRFTRDGAVDAALNIRPNGPIHNPTPDFLFGTNIFWQLDIWRELRNARDAAQQRYLAAIEKRNAFVTRLVADVAENYYGLLALDRRIEVLDQTIAIQEKSYDTAKLLFTGARITELPVQRFQAEVRKNQSEKLIVRQEIVEVENKINFLVGRFPQPVERGTSAFAAYLNLNIHTLSVGIPSQLLLNRPDIRQAERELVAAGLDIKVARAHFFPRLDLSAGVGYESFNPKYLFNTPQALIANVAGDLTAPLINKSAIKAEYLTANAQQLESVYNYQRVILNAFAEVVNRMSMAENYRKSIEIKQQQLVALDAAIDVATKLFNNVRAEYIEVLLVQRDMLEARTVLIETKRQQLSAIVNAYQALGGGNSLALPAVLPDLSHPHKDKVNPR